MKSLPKLFFAAVLTAAAVAGFASVPDASNGHFVVVNNSDISGDNYGTVFKLGGNRSNPVLTQVASLNTESPSRGDGIVPSVQVARAGSDLCVFLAEPDSNLNNVITSFRYPNFTLVGNYSLTNLANGVINIGLVASGGRLFASYNGYDNGYPATSYLASWTIGAGCTLTLVQTYPITAVSGVFSMAVSPNGKTLVASYEFDGTCCIGSFSIGADGSLTQHGPYYVFNASTIWGVDITADSKYAIFSIVGDCQPHPVCHAQININPINPDGSLGDGPTFGGDGSLGEAHAGGYVRLSPDERFLFATDDWQEVTTLNFTESPLNITFSGCLTELKIPEGEPSVISQAIATAGRSGAGRAIYVAETASVALLAVNEKTGCTTEASSSPFLIPDVNVNSASLVAWPPRGF